MVETAIVILNYNGENFLSQFLPSIIQHCANEEIIVADNCSTDNSTNFLKKNFPTIKLIELKENYGFTGGYNRIISELPHKYCVLLNSDVEVTPNWTQPIIRFMNENENVAACQPKILSYHEKSSFEYAGAAGGFIDTLGFPYCRGRIFETLELDENQYDETLKVFWATGACMFVRVKDFIASGGFDEDFFAHMEEIDLCWRFHLMKKEVYCIPESLVYHVGGGTLSKSNPRKTYFNFRNNLSMLFKNETVGKLIWKLPLKLSLDWIAAFKFWFDNSFSHFLAVIRAHFYFFSNISKNYKKRGQVNGLRKGSVIVENQGLIISTYFLKGLKKYSDFKK
ncbi:MAG: glycosyltransferase family 2 protein [Reichenbachiella sp.]